MEMIARELLKVAKAVVRTEMTFERSPKADNSRMNVIHYEVSRFLDAIRGNEKLETFVNREDDDKVMTLKVGISDHEAVKAIAQKITDLAEGVADKYDIRMKK